MTYTLDKDNMDFLRVVDFVRFTNANLLIIGKGGTGKSELIKYLKRVINKEIIVLAPTGLAALNVNGSTIHSFFRLPLRPMLPIDPIIKPLGKNSNLLDIIKIIDTIIIDEISMIKPYTLDAIDQILRINLAKPNVPFGGKQIILIGDIFQLPPVMKDENNGESRTEQLIIKNNYSSAFFWGAKVFREANFISIILQKTYRQANSLFLEILDKIRLYDFPESAREILNSRQIEKGMISDLICLTSRNDDADSINTKQMAKIASPEKIYDGMVKDDFPKEMMKVPKSLKLKIGTKIMFLKNHPKGKWINGSMGTIVGLLNKSVWVDLEGKRLLVKQVVWKNISYSFDTKLKSITEYENGKYKQLPIKPAYAITIHKSQGLTFDKLIIDLPSGAFLPGQLYVALSRCRTLEGIFLRTSLNQTDVIINQEILNFFDEIQEKNKKQNIDEVLSILIKNYNDDSAIKIKANVDIEQGSYYYDKKDYEQAVEYLLRGFTSIITPGLMYKKGLFHLGHALIQIANYSEAINFLSKHIELDDNTKDGYYFRAIAYENLGEKDAAKHDFIMAARRGSTKAKEHLKLVYSNTL